MLVQHFSYGCGYYFSGGVVVATKSMGRVHVLEMISRLSMPSLWSHDFDGRIFSFLPS